MKKILLRAGICIVTFCILINTAYSLDVMLGAKAGYYVWKPYFKEMGPTGFSDIDRGSGVLYGPIISLLFTPDLSFSLAGLTGVQTTHWFSSNKYDPTVENDVSGTYYVNMNRTDIDSALSYRLTENFKIFAGYKVQIIKVNIKYSERRYDPVSDTGVVNDFDQDFETPAHGPALGIGFSLPLGKSYFVAANISGLYMWGKFKSSEGWMTSYKTDNFGSDSGEVMESLDIDTKMFGVNFEPSVGLSVTDRGPIITLGFRYQLLRTKLVDDVEGENPGWLNDIIYGAFVSVIYIF